MPGSSSNASFIPKRGTTPRHNKSRGGRIYLLTIVSYVLIIASLIASGAIFFYERHVASQLQEEISIMNAEVNNFKQANLEQIQEFDNRLNNAKQRLNYSVSLSSIFDAIEDATIQSVQINSLSLLRDNDERIVLEAEIKTDSFDSSLFQRTVFERNSLIKEVEVQDLTLGTEETGDESSEAKKTVSFSAHLSVPLDSIPYTPNKNVESVVETVVQPVVEEQSSSTDEVANQEESI